MWHNESQFSVKLNNLTERCLQISIIFAVILEWIVLNHIHLPFTFQYPIMIINEQTYRSAVSGKDCNRYSFMKCQTRHGWTDLLTNPIWNQLWHTDSCDHCVWNCPRYLFHTSKIYDLGLFTWRNSTGLEIRSAWSRNQESVKQDRDGAAESGEAGYRTAIWTAWFSIGTIEHFKMPP